jgi:TetR/AcrR family transcriptional regulator, transcriptional repressor for nem operon
MSHPTRLALLEAGHELCVTTGLARLTVDAIVKKAGVAKGTFYVHFPDRTSFLVALHVQFYDRLRATILKAIEGLSPGGERLRTCTTTYLDECLQERALKALLLEARSEAPMSAEAQRRKAEFSALSHADFTALGWPDADSSAQLFAVLVAEVALTELETGHNDAVRQALWRFARVEHSG